MLTFSLHNSQFNNLSFFLEKNPNLAQFIPEIYNKNYYKNYRVFLGRYIGFAKAKQSFTKAKEALIRK